MLLVLKKKSSEMPNDEGLGRSRGGLTSKIHCIVDSLGNPVDFLLTGGQEHESKYACPLLKGKETKFVVGDKAFDSDEIIEMIVHEMEATPVIPSKSNRTVHREHDKHYYKDRNLVERFFCRLKQFRGIATRYCKRGKYYLEAVKLASFVILMA